MRLRTANRRARKREASQGQPLEALIYLQQDRLIEELEEEDGEFYQTNMGWAVLETRREIDVSTKVYGVGILRSVADKRTRAISHWWGS